MPLKSAGAAMSLATTLGSRPDMSKLDEQLAGLMAMSSAQLRGEWQRVCREPAPAALSPDLLARGLAYRLQERAHGGLPSGVRRDIARLVRQLERTGEVSTEREVVLKTGTRLVRDWRGRTHNVLVLDDGFLFEDRRYRSLSRIASEITGANWSGPRFFGLRRRPKAFADLAASEQRGG
jgi:hypothetical protein